MVGKGNRSRARVPGDTRPTLRSLADELGLSPAGWLARRAPG
jgi:hypothetical protein